MRLLAPKKTTLIPLLKTSNLADGGYLGTAQTLAFLGPSLKPRDINPHATLIALYMNAVEEWVVEYQGEDLDTSAEFNRVEPYIISDDFDLSSYERSESTSTRFSWRLRLPVVVMATCTLTGMLHSLGHGTRGHGVWITSFPLLSTSLPRSPPFLISSLARCSL
jgi:hypothetical protein